jgi:hypothetical protein
MVLFHSDDFQEVMDAKLANDKYKLYRNAAILAYASMVAKTCAPGSNFGVPCTSNRLETWQKTFFNKFISKLHSFNESVNLFDCFHVKQLPVHLRIVPCTSTLCATSATGRSPIS